MSENIKKSLHPQAQMSCFVWPTVQKRSFHSHVRPLKQQILTLELENVWKIT